MNKKKLTDGPVHKHLIAISFPAMLGVMMFIGFQMVDAYYVSLLGTQALAALSFTFPVTFLFFSLILGYGSSISSISARLIGSKRLGRVRRILPHTYLLALITSSIATTLCFFFHDHLFTLLGAKGEMLDKVREYMMIWLINAIPMSIIPVSNGTMRAFGDSRSPALAVTIATGTNIILDPFFIFGIGPFPEMRLQGAALATTLSGFMGAFTGFYFVQKRKKLVSFHHIKKPILFLHSAREVLRFALPASLSHSVSPLVNSFITAVLANAGAQAVAAYGIVTRLESFVMVPFMALLMGAAPIIGQNWGAKEFKRVRDTLKLSIGTNIAWSVSIALLLSSLAYPLTYLFSKDPDVVRYCIMYLTLVPFSFAFGNIVSCWSSAFNAMGMPLRSFTLTVTKGLLFTLPAVAIGFYIDHVQGVFLGMCLENFCAGLLFHYWSKHTLDYKSHLLS